MIRLPAVAVIALALAGCASLPPPETVSTTPLPLLGGKLGVSVEGAPDRSFSAGFELQGDTDTGRLALSNPLGLRLGEARWKPDGADLFTNEGVRHYGSAQELAQDLLGESVPLQALPSWLKGLPWPGAPSEPLSAPQSGFRQFDWQVDTSQAQEGRFVAVRTQPAPKLTVRVRVVSP